MKWALYKDCHGPIEQAKQINIVPVDDLHEHEFGANCKCEPKIESDGRTFLYTHNLFEVKEAK